MPTKSRRAIIFCWGIVPAVVGIVLAMGAIALNNFGRLVSEVTDVRKYAQTIDRLNSANLSSPNALAGIPAAIPSGAVNPRMFYRPHFLQGGTVFEVRFGLPASQINAIQASVASASLQTTRGSNDAFDHLADHGGLPTTDFRSANNSTFAPLPPDFTVYVLAAKPTFGSNWNNGYSNGIAISHQSNEIIYWLWEW